MEKFISVLEKDHGAFLKILETLKEQSNIISRGGEVGLITIVSATQLIIDYCVDYHFCIEEKFLFPEMDRHYKNPLEEISAPMLVEHDECRGFIADINEAVRDYKNGFDSRERLTASIEGLELNLKTHLINEERAAYKSAEILLSDFEKRKIDKELAIARKEFGEAKIEEIEFAADRFLTEAA